MSATMARQGGRVQLEQANLPLALNMATMAKRGFSRARIEDMRYLMKKPWAKVQQEKKQGVECPGDTNMKAAMGRHLAMLWEQQTDGYLPGQNVTAQNPQTCWRCHGTGAPPPEQLRQSTPEQMPHPPGMPPVPPSDNRGYRASQIEGVLPGYVYIQTPHSSAQLFNLDAYAMGCKCD